MDCVLVTDATERAALAITRSLGEKGIRIIACGTTPKSLAGQSRHCSKYYQFAHSIYQHPDAYIDFLRNIVSEQGVNAIFPVTDLSTEVILKNQSLFTHRSDIKIITPRADCYNTVSNKNQLFKIAKSVNVAVPYYLEFNNAIEVDINKIDIPYPIVIKPYKSILYDNGNYSSSSVKIAYNETELVSLLKQNACFQNHPFTLQTYIKGKGAGVFALYHNGNNFGLFAHKRLKEKPPAGGVSVLSESVTVPEDLRKFATLLLEKVNWTGMAMVEFKISEDGTPYLMEINGRPWGSIQLAIDSGFDFPYLAYLSAVNKPIHSIDEYQVGYKLRWLLGDLDRLYLVWKSQIKLSDKFSETLAFFNFFNKNVKFEVNRLSDIKPFFHEIHNYFRQLIQ